MIELARIVKGWYLGIRDIGREYYADGDRWLPLTDEVRNQERWEEDIMHVCCGYDILMNYLQYVPGFDSSSHYGDLYVEFDLNGVVAAGWSENQLTECLQFIANHVNNGKAVVAQCSVYVCKSIDFRNVEHTRPSFGALIPPEGMKTLEIEHPVGLTN